jgi:hypothetical protein
VQEHSVLILFRFWRDWVMSTQRKAKAERSLWEVMVAVDAR